jgi:hypothetical protein
MKKTYRYCTALIAAVFFCGFAPWNNAVGAVLINEFMASNGGTVADEDGDFEDWIELYNNSPSDVDLSGWGLSDNATNPFKWQFPEGTVILAQDYLFVWASGKDRQLHSNFRIASAGEDLLLTRPDGKTIDAVAPVFLPHDISFGRQPDGGETWHYFEVATPGAANNSMPVLMPPTVTFSEPRGFKSAPFHVTLHTTDPSAVIRYTLDGSEPNLLSAVYSEPLLVAATTTLRASVVGPGMITLPPTTATYLFLDDVLQQDATPPPGWPANRAINNHVMEYGMRQQIVAGDNARLRAGMTAIPSLSLVTDLAHLFDPETGIYSHSNRSHGWERPVSVELIDPVRGPSAEFHMDAGLRLRGAFSRSTSNPKHSFRLLFRSAYGENRLRFPLFDDEGATEFDRVDLRTAQNYSWAFENSNHNTFLRDVFSRDSQRDMGMPYTRSRYYHLYLNGQYWGLYMTQERGESSFAATYLGGDSDDWDTIKTSHPGYTTQAADGNFDAFYALHDIAIHQGFTGARADNYWRIRGLNPDGTRNPEFPVYLDQDNLISYMLIAHYTGDPDSPVSIWGGFPNNLYGLFNRAAPDGFKWLRHDAEHSLGAHGGYGVTTDTTQAGTGSAFTRRSHFNPAILHARLMQHPEYAIRFADLVQQHLYGDGALTPANARARVQSRMNEIDLAIIGESARWGRGRTRDATWIPAANAVLSYLEQRRDIIAGHFRRHGWLPGVEAPVFTRVNGTVRISAEAPFYYMTDGTDPRLPGGGIHPEAVRVRQEGVTVEPLNLIALKARAYADGEWSALAAISTLADLPEGTPIHQWDFEHPTDYQNPSYSIGGGALTVVPGDLTVVSLNAAAQGFETSHLRINHPLDSILHMELPTPGFQHLQIAYETRRSGQGAGLQTLEYTTDGVTWTKLLTYEIQNADPQSWSFSLANVEAANHNPHFALRISFAQGNGGMEGNHRFDDFTLFGVPLPDDLTPPELQFVSMEWADTGEAILAFDVRAASGSEMILETSTDLVSWSTAGQVTGAGLITPVRISADANSADAVRVWRLRVDGP